MSRGSKAKRSKVTPVQVTPTLAPIMLPDVTVRTFKAPATVYAPYVPALPPRASVVALTAQLQAVMVYVPSPVWREPVADAQKPYVTAGLPRATGAVRSYAATRLIQGTYVRSMVAVLGLRAVNAMPSMHVKGRRSNGAVRPIDAAQTYSPSPDAYSYGKVPPVPLTGFIGSLPLTRPSGYPRKSADGEPIRFPYPRKGESGRSLW